MDALELSPADGSGARSPTPEAIAEETVRSAVVCAIEDDRVLAHIQSKDGLTAGEGEIPLREFRSAIATRAIEIGDRFEVFVERKEPEGDRWLLSKEKADRLRLWKDLVTAFEEKRTIDGEIVGPVEGGFSVDIGVRAFLPGSQADIFPVREPDRLIGARLQFRIIKFHKNRSNIVLSRRVLLEEERARALGRLEVGASVDGVVKSFAEYGAFVDLGGVQGLLHITDLSWGRVGHPSEVLHLGDPVRVKILKIDPSGPRISLGLRQLQDDPWLGAEKKYAVGREVSGAVVSITDYGVFLELEPGVEGLVHTRGAMPGTSAAKESLKRASIGDRISAVVLETDIAKKRISLALKDAS